MGIFAGIVTYDVDTMNGMVARESLGRTPSEADQARERGVGKFPPGRTPITE
jgi:hypothetical protein